jgi:hypothetical protein
MKPIQFFLFVSTIVAFSSCRTTQNTTYYSWRSSEINLPSSIKKVGLLDRTVPATRDRSTIFSSNADEKNAKKTVQNVHLVLKNNPILTSELIYGNFTSITNGKKLGPPMDWAVLDSLGRKYSLDAIAACEVFDTDVDVNLGQNMWGGPGFGGVSVQFDKSINTSWRLYDLQNRNIIDESQSKDWVGGTQTGINPWGGIMIPTGWSGSTSSAIPMIAFGYASRIAPTQWETVRGFYIRGNENMKRAKNEVNRRKWKNAVSIWKMTYEKNSNSAKLRSRAAYNLAVASEMSFEPDIAIEWIDKALDLRNQREYLQYREILVLRAEDKDRLNQQLINAGKSMNDLPRPALSAY